MTVMAARATARPPITVGETDAERLTALGCRIAQGWLYARALPGDEVGRLLGASVGPMAAEAVTAAPALT